MIKIKTEPLDYQVDAIEKLSALKVGALYMDMGTGKTRVGIELVKNRLDAGKVTHVLWLCPYSVMATGDLERNFDTHSDGWRDCVTICGIETLSSSLKTFDKLVRLARDETLFLVVDESSLVKNPGAIRTKNITRIAAMCPYRLILNGTPISKNEADLFSQWYLLDWRILGYRSFWSFSANHLQLDEETNRVRRVLNVEYLTRKISPYTYEIRKEDCLKLPEKKYQIKSFNLTDEQMDNYTDVSERMMLNLDEFRPETIYRTFGALQACTSGWLLAVYSDQYHYDKYPAFLNPAENPRMIALTEILKSLPQGEKVIIYCHYTQEIDDISLVLNSAVPGSAVRFMGEQSKRNRASALDAFTNDVQYLVANKGCAKYGLNLQFCHNEIFYSNDWDYATREQAEDRAHRIGQTEDVQIWDIVADSTLDMSIQQSLSRKETLLDSFKRNLKGQNKDVKKTIRAMIQGLKEE